MEPHYAQNLSISILIKIQDKDGHNLLNPNSPDRIDESDLNRITFEGTKKRMKVNYNPMKLYPKDFNITDDWRSNYYLSFLAVPSKKQRKMFSNFLQIGKKKLLFNIRFELDEFIPTSSENLFAGSIWIKKVWLNGKLVWRADPNNRQWKKTPN